MMSHVFLPSPTVHPIITQRTGESQWNITDTPWVPSFWMSTPSTQPVCAQKASALSLLWEPTTDTGLWSDGHWGTVRHSTETAGVHSSTLEWKSPWGVCPFSHVPGPCQDPRPCHRVVLTHRCRLTLPLRPDHRLCILSVFQARGRMWSTPTHFLTAWEGPSAPPRWVMDQCQNALRLKQFGQVVFFLEEDWKISNTFMTKSNHFHLTELSQRLSHPLSL